MIWKKRQRNANTMENPTFLRLVLETMRKKKSEATKSTNYHGKHIQQLFNVDA